MLSLPIKKEGDPFFNQKNFDYVPRRLFGRLCWLKYAISAVLRLSLCDPRGIAYEWRGQVWTCYMRIHLPWRNAQHRFLVEHVHDSFWDPLVDPVTGRTHFHTIDGSADPWSKKVLTPEGTNCWCLVEK